MDLVSPQPFWPLRNGLLSVYPPLRRDLACDVVVLGGGISGAFVAEALAREGLHVVVVDKREIGGGSTSASTALLQYEIDTPLIELSKKVGRRDAERSYRLCHDSIDSIERLVEDLKVECVFQRRQSVYLATRSSDAEMLRQEGDARRSMGIDVEYWDESEVASRFSFSRPAALRSSQAAELDCHRLTHALLARAATSGACVFDRTLVEQYDAGASSVRLRTDRGCTITAGHAVFATGYEAQEFLPKRIVKLKSTYALASEPLDAFAGWWERCLIWETARPYLYLRTTDDDRALVGGEDDSFRNPARRDRLVNKKTDLLAARFGEMFPAIELEVAYRWAGTFGETKDGLAFIGQIRQMPRCYFALGFGGNGITYSVIAAEIIRDALLQRPNADARLFRFDR
ncbi:MAG TPA: FAD-dependent oxidoreductase [Terrimicrobiaceae bacterium]|nr:FAD-dependent oxidoreductase [Terrimicrobiaceae bacterium]